MLSNRSSISNSLLRVVSLNASSSSIASTVSAFRHHGLALRRSFSNLSGRTFSAFKRRSSHHTGQCPILPDEFDDVPFLIPASQTHPDDEVESRARKMSRKVIDGCSLCVHRIKPTVQDLFEAVCNHTQRGNYPRASETAEKLLPKIPPLCRPCRVVSYQFIMSVLYDVALYHGHEGRYRESMDIYEKLLHICIEDDLYKCSFVMFNVVERLVHIYAYQGLLHEIEQKLLEAIADEDNTTKLAWICNHLMLSRIYTLQHRPRDALREYGNLSTACIEFYGLHSAFMHQIVFSCAQACEELDDWKTSADLYRRMLTEQDPTDFALQNRILKALIGLSDIYRYAGSIQGCKKYAYLATDVLRAVENALTHLDSKRIFYKARCHFNLAVSYEKEGKFDESESYFSQVVGGCERLNERGNSFRGVSILLALQQYYYEQPRRIDSLDATISGNHLARLSDAASESPAALQCLLVTVIQEADAQSRSQQYQRADYLFNEARGLLNPSNPRLQLYFAIQIAQHHRRKEEWKYVSQFWEQAVMLSKQMYGLTHPCTITFVGQLAAFNEEMEARGVPMDAIAQSLSFRTVSSVNTQSTGSNEFDELEFLEDGMVWGQPPASFLNFA